MPDRPWTNLIRPWSPLLLVPLTFVVAANQWATAKEWPEKGAYSFDRWAGPELGVQYAMPSAADGETPILIVVPGANRNAAEYRDQWQALCEANLFICLALEGSINCFPTEYDYNAGTVVSSDGVVQPEEEWLFTAIELIFDDFCERFGSNCQTYSIFGHSAGGGFVHRFALFKPNARFDAAVAANPAFFTMPNRDSMYPFGLRGASLSDGATSRWFRKRLFILLGDQDTGPRSRPLSGGPTANEQGPGVFTRGLRFFRSALIESEKIEVPLRWQLQVVHGVGHSNTEMAAHALGFLFP